MGSPVKERVIDLTLVLEPAELWADPSAVPPWPYVPPGYPLHVPNTRQAAEAALQALREALNPAGAPLRDPSEAERASLKERLFAPVVPQPFDDPDEAAWKLRHGISGLRPRAPHDKRPEQVIEAAHIRAYLRNLDEAERTAKERAENSKTTRARHTLDQSVAVHAERVAELAGLREAADRHRQRVEDERAFYRVNEIRRNELPGLESQARQAANTLGEPTPTFATVE